MTYSFKNETSYEELVEAGLPRLPEGFTYKFKIVRFGEDAGALRCSIRETFLGFIPLWVNSRLYLPLEDLGIEQVWDVEDIVYIGQFTHKRTLFPKKQKRAQQSRDVMRFLNRRLP